MIRQHSFSVFGPPPSFLSLVQNWKKLDWTCRIANLDIMSSSNLKDPFSFFSWVLMWAAPSEEEFSATNCPWASTRCNWISLSGNSICSLWKAQETNPQTHTHIRQLQFLQQFEQIYIHYITLVSSIISDNMCMRPMSVSHFLCTCILCFYWDYFRPQSYSLSLLVQPWWPACFTMGYNWTVNKCTLSSKTQY